MAHNKETLHMIARFLMCAVLIHISCPASAPSKSVPELHKEETALADRIRNLKQEEAASEPDLRERLLKLANMRYDMHKKNGVEHEVVALLKKYKQECQQHHVSEDNNGADFYKLDKDWAQAKTAQEKQDIDRKTFFRFRNMLGRNAKDVFNTVVLGYCNGQPKETSSFEHLQSFVWAHDGTRFVCRSIWDEFRVYDVSYGTISPISGGASRLPYPEPLYPQPKKRYHLSGYALSPDGTRLAVLVHDGNVFVRHLGIIDLEKPDLVLWGAFIPQSFVGPCFTWSPQGIRFGRTQWNHQGELVESKVLDQQKEARAQEYTAGEACMVYRNPPLPQYDAVVRECHGGQDVNFGHTERMPELSGDRKLLATVPHESTVAIWNVSSGPQQQSRTFDVPQESRAEVLKWHPTLPILSVVAYYNSYNRDVILLNAAAEWIRTIHRIKFSPKNRSGEQFLYAWSPDGLSLVYVRARGLSPFGSGCTIHVLQPDIVPCQAQEGAKVAVAPQTS